MHIGIEGTTPGAGWGKELSLLVKEWSSPISCEMWINTDTPHPVTFWHPWVGSNLEVIGESTLHSKAVWFLSVVGQNPQVEISTHRLIYISYQHRPLCL